MKQPKNYVKKNQKNKVLLYFVAFPILFTGLFYYALYQTVTYIEARDNAIRNEAYELGRYDQLNEDAENTQLEVKTKQLEVKNKLLSSLAFHESSNGKFRKVLDTNNLYSMGLYHFQNRTVKDMYRRYYKINLTTDEATEIANNDVKATALAYEAIFNRKELFHWHNSMLKMQKEGLITYEK